MNIEVLNGIIYNFRPLYYFSPKERYKIARNPYFYLDYSNTYRLVKLTESPFNEESYKRKDILIGPLK